MVLFSIIESAAHPTFSNLYSELGFKEVQFSSVRKAIQALKRQPPDIVLADFLYGYGNNYAGVNISNLDVFLYSLEKYAPDCQVIAFYEKSEREYITQFEALFPKVTCLVYPIQESQLKSLLSK